MIDAHHFACGLHLGPQVSIDPDQLRHRKNWGLDRDQVLSRPEAGCVTEVRQRLAEHHLNGETDHRYTCYLREERDGAAGTWIDLEDVNVRWRPVRALRFRAHDHVLDIHQALHAESRA